jgi:hypothetical protein
MKPGEYRLPMLSGSFSANQKLYPEQTLSRPRLLRVVQFWVMLIDRLRPWVTINILGTVLGAAVASRKPRGVKDE